MARQSTAENLQQTAGGPPPEVDQRTMTLSCVACRAPLLLDLSATEARCGHCHAPQPQADALLSKARAHLEHVDRLAANAESHREEAEAYARLHKRGVLRGVLGALLINGLVIGSFWAVYGVYLALATVVGEVLGKLLALPVALGGLWALLLLYAKVFGRSERGREAVEVGQASCNNCGATMPVVLGDTSRCPFCDARLLAGERTRQQAEAEAAAELSAARDEVLRARQAYAEKTTQQVHKSSKYGYAVLGFYLGSMAGGPLAFVFREGGTPVAVAACAITGVLGAKIALAIHRRRTAR